MKLEKLKFYIEAFREKLKKDRLFEDAYKYECLENFTNNWNVESKDLYEIYKHSFQSKYSGRFWGGERHSSKSMMLELIKENPEFMRSSFRDLFNENKGVSLRMDRFMLHCNEVFHKIQKKHPKFSDHLHARLEILSVYLSFAYPTRYTPFDYPSFYNFMVLLESRDIPMEFEIERFFKICRTIYLFLTKDIELMEIHRQKLNDAQFYQKPSLLIVHDLYTSFGSKI